MVAAYKLTTPLQDEASAESLHADQTNWPAERIWSGPAETSAKSERSSAPTYLRYPVRAEVTAASASTTAKTPNDENAVWTLFQRPLRQLSELRELPADWDENGAYPVTPFAFRAASHMLASIMVSRNRLLRVRAIPSTLFPLPTGGLNIQWRNRSGLIDVEVAPDGQLNLVRQTGHGIDATYEDSEGLTEDVVLRQVAELTLWPT